jgi:transposase
VKKSVKLTTKQRTELSAVISDAERTSREIKHAQAILLIDQEIDQHTIEMVTAYTGKHAYKLRRRYLQSGIEAITDRRTPKPKELLTRIQRVEIIEIIKTKKPSELGSYYQNYEYWTTGVLGEYIKRAYQIEYKSKTSHYLLFKEARFTYHKPGRVSERRDEQEVKEWRKKAKKRIEQAWHDKDAVILTEDEMHLSNQTTVQKIWLPQGEYPKIEIARKRDARSIYGFLNVKTGDEHAFKTKWQNMYITAQIIPKVRELYPDKKILLAWDQAGWHKGSEAQKVIKEDGNIEIIYFPAAAPDENPQEHVWKSGRSQCAHNKFMKDMDTATDEFVSYLNTTKFPYSLLGLSIKT